MTLGRSARGASRPSALGAGCARNLPSGLLTCGFFHMLLFHMFSMTHHVECVAILEPADKGR